MPRLRVDDDDDDASCAGVEDILLDARTDAAKSITTLLSAVLLSNKQVASAPASRSQPRIWDVLSEPHRSASRRMP